MKVVILRMSRVTTLDATGAHVLGDAIARLERRGITVMLSGITPGHDSLRSKGLIFPDTPATIAHARRQLLLPDHGSPPREGPQSR